MTRSLELDAFAPQPDNITYKGKTYEVFPPEIGPLLQMMRSIHDIQDIQSQLTGGMPTDGVIEKVQNTLDTLIAFVKKHVPDFPTDALTLQMVAAIIRFMAQSGDDVTAELKPVTPAETEKKTDNSPPALETPSQG